MSDYALMSLAPQAAGQLPASVARFGPASPSRLQDEMLVAAFNDIGMVESLIEEQKDELAGVHRRAVSSA